MPMPNRKAMISPVSATCRIAHCMGDHSSTAIACAQGPTAVPSHCLRKKRNTAMPDSRLVLISVNKQLPQATAYNRALQELAKEYGCQYAEAPTGEMSEAYELQFFQTLRGFFYDHTMNLSDIFRYCG